MRIAATNIWPDARAGRCGGEVGWRVLGAKQQKERMKKIVAWARWGLHGKRLNNARYCTYRLMASRPLGGTLFGVAKRHISTTKGHQKSVFRHVNFFLFQVIFFPGLGAVVVTFFPGLAAGPGTSVGVPSVRRNTLWLISRKEYYNQTFTFSLFTTRILKSLCVFLGDEARENPRLPSYR